MANTTTGIEKEKEKGQKDKIGIDDIGIFEFIFVNSHLLKGVATMAELTKLDSRQPMGKIKPTDKMVMMLEYSTIVTVLLLFFPMDYIFVRTSFSAWNILSFNPKTMDADEHIDLINTLGDMVDQKEEAKKEKFIETMPTMIQTHLITCKDWDMVKDTTKSLEHIIMKCDPPTPAMPMMATGATVPGLYSHIAHSVDKEEGDIPQPGAKPKQTRGRGKPKGKPQNQRQNPPKIQEVEETYNYESPNNYYHNTPSQSQGRRPYNGQSGNRQFRGLVPQNRGQRPQYSQCQFQNYCYQRSAPQKNRTQYGSTCKPYFQGNQLNACRGWG